MRPLVLDTNVLVSGVINPFGAPGRILDLVREGALTLAVDDRILAEYADVLNRPKFRAYFPPEEVRDIVRFLERNTLYTVCTESVHDLPDATDSPFLEVALNVGAPLVTGNAGHFPADCCRGVAVLPPGAFLATLAEET